MSKIRAFLDDTAQIIGPSFDFEQKPSGRSERERDIAQFVLDKAKEVYEAAQKIGGVKPLPRIKAQIERAVYVKKYSKAEEGPRKAETQKRIAEKKMPENISEDELECRRLLTEYGNKLAESGLVQGTWGNLSIRLDGDCMLVTPSGIDYAQLRPEHMVKVNIHTLEYGADELKPTSEKGLHAAIYRERPDVRAVIHTHSTYACVYAACEKDLPVKGPAADVFGSYVKTARYGFAGTDKLAGRTREALGNGTGAIMAHHGMLVVGSGLENAFENALLLEETAKSSLDIK